MKLESHIIISDNNIKGKLVNKNEASYLVSEIGNKKISELKRDNQNLLIFPSSENKMLDRIGDEYVFSFSEYSNTYSLKTGNILGFIGCSGQQLTIKSRFSKNENDFFFHYLLKRVFNINLFDLQHGQNKDNIFDFLPFLFPYYLNRALKQGLYKEYQQRKYNDANIKGPVDINRHINLNIPFNGKIAYKTREFAYDNPVTELIRHTIEFISKKSMYQGVLDRDENTKHSIAQIVLSTYLYNEKERKQILSKTLKPIKSPYFQSYNDLQKICRMILLREKIKYSKDNNQIYGILFDGAWLWEEYLAFLLRENGYKHPENKNKKGAIFLFKNSSKNIDIEGDDFICHTSKCSRYPDFYKPRNKNSIQDGCSVILDAKYKHLEKGRIDRDDMHQVISYMHVEHSDYGGYLYPIDSQIEKVFFHSLGELRGPWGGRMFTIGIPCGLEVQTFNQFKEKMRIYESQVKSITAKPELAWEEN